MLVQEIWFGSPDCFPSWESEVGDKTKMLHFTLKEDPDMSYFTFTAPTLS